MITNKYNNFKTNRSVLNNKTNTGNTKPLPEQKQPLERIRFKVDKSLIVGESEYSLLYKVNDKQVVWISKKICFANNFTNWINVSPLVNTIFKILPNSEVLDTLSSEELECSVEEISAENFKKLVEENGVNRKWI